MMDAQLAVLLLILKVDLIFAEDCLTDYQNKPCVFPFIYKGKTYNECTKVEHSKYWCSTQTSAEGEYIASEWGNCKSTCPLACEPFSATACETAADKLDGFKKGGLDYDFQGDYSTKGCYAYKDGKYKGHVYYGTGGTEQEMKGDLNGDTFRPQAYDCGCEPFSVKACKTAADKLDGFKKGGLGYDFQGDYSTKGCYAYKDGKYKGHVYYGTGGNEQKMKEELNGDKFRPQAYDCGVVNPECPTKGYTKMRIWNKGFGNVGENFRSDVPSSASCGVICDQTEDCCSYQWEDGSRKCYLWSQCQPERSDKYNSVTFMTLGTMDCMRQRKLRDCSASGYLPVNGHNQGSGNVGINMKTVKFSDQCRVLCDETEDCCSYQWSLTTEKCLLWSQCRPNQEGVLDDYVLMSKSPCWTQCPSGYASVVGFNQVLGDVGIKSKPAVTHPDDCGDLCDKTEGCKSFMWSSKTEKCLIFKGDEPDEQTEKGGYIFCKEDKHAYSQPQTLGDMLVNSRGTVKQVFDLIEGIGTNLQKFTDADKKERPQLLRIKRRPNQQVFRRNDIKRRPLGRNVKVVKVNGVKKYKVKGIRYVAGKLGNALSSMSTLIAPLFIIGDLVWGSSGSQNHKEVMDKLKTLDTKIDNLDTKLRQQTNTIDRIIQMDTYKKLIAHLQTIGDAYDKYLDRKTDHEDILITSRKDTLEDLNHLRLHITDTFTAHLKDYYGRCYQLDDMRVWLGAILTKALLGSTLGCVLRETKKGKTLENGLFDPARLCLMEIEREHILNIESKMDAILSKCNEKHVAHWTKEYITDSITSGTATEKKDKLEKYFKDTFPSFFYSIVVVDKKMQQKCKEELIDIHLDAKSNADVMMEGHTGTDGRKHDIYVSISKVERPCDANIANTRTEGVGCVKSRTWPLDGGRMCECSMPYARDVRDKLLRTLLVSRCTVALYASPTRLSKGSSFLKGGSGWYKWSKTMADIKTIEDLKKNQYAYGPEVKQFALQRYICDINNDYVVAEANNGLVPCKGVVQCYFRQSIFRYDYVQTFKYFCN